MRVRRRIIILAAVFCILIVEVCYLKMLPSSFVRIYYTSELKDFSNPPTKEMTVEIDGYEFSYYIPHMLKGNNLKEIENLINGRDLDTIAKVIIIANWVRGKLKYGDQDCSGDKNIVGDILSSSKNMDLIVLCNIYARLFVIACQSIDIPARIIELEGHVVPEAFVVRIGKWVMIDPTFGYYISKNNEPLSVVEMIDCYKKGIPLTPNVFAENRGDDPLYSGKDEVYLKKVYLNGYTVISDQNVDGKKMKDTILKTLRFPIAKMQFVETQSTLIGYKEKMLRYAIVITFALFVIVSITAFSKDRENT